MTATLAATFFSLAVYGCDRVTFSRLSIAISRLVCGSRQRHSDVSHIWCLKANRLCEALAYWSIRFLGFVYEVRMIRELFYS